MRIEIGSNPDIGVDRDSTANNFPAHHRQGFCVYLDGVEIHFDDEADAERLAKAILKREGYAEPVSEARFKAMMAQVKKVSWTFHSEMTNPLGLQWITNVQLAIWELTKAHDAIIEERKS